MAEQCGVEEIYAPESFEGSEGLLAIIVYSGYQTDGITFFTPPESPQQLAFMRHTAGKVIEPHTHNAIRRVIDRTQEVLLVRKGVLELTLYTSDRQPVVSRMLGPGDVVILMSGGHGFVVREEAELWEVKQGPYLGKEKDKAIFWPGV